MGKKNWGGVNVSEKVSVIVPVYNVKDYLERCVVSICTQIYKNIEIILIDDGSTDKSSVICDELAKSDNRIQVVHKKMVAYLMQETRVFKLQQVI